MNYPKSKPALQTADNESGHFRPIGSSAEERKFNRRHNEALLKALHDDCDRSNRRFNFYTRAHRDALGELGHAIAAQDFNRESIAKSRLKQFEPERLAAEHIEEQRTQIIRLKRWTTFLWWLALAGWISLMIELYRR